MLLKLKFNFTFGSIITPRRKRSESRSRKTSARMFAFLSEGASKKNPLLPPDPLDKRTANQNRGGRQETPEKKSPIPSSGLLASQRAALGQDRASMAILERYRHASSRPLRVLSARQGVYPSHLAASFSTVPSSWSFLMASLIALVSSGLSLFTATAYSSPVATSRTTWASL